MSARRLKNEGNVKVYKVSVLQRFREVPGFIVWNKQKVECVRLEKTDGKLWEALVEVGIKNEEELCRTRPTVSEWRMETVLR